MKKSTKIIFNTNGNLIFQCRLTADRKSRSINPPDNDDADYVDFAAKQFFLSDIGKIYMVAVCQYVGPKNDLQPKYDHILFEEDNGEGWAGNSDHTVKRYHGWRGTTNDWSICGEGVRRCLSASISGERSKVIRFVFGKDLKRMEV